MPIPAFAPVESPFFVLGAVEVAVEGEGRVDVGVPTEEVGADVLL